MPATIAKDARIAIIGAGPAGLAAAEALKEKGYQNILVLEKRNRVGGQALSKSYKTADGTEVIYDLGSVQPISTGVGIFKRLLKRYDIHIGRGISKEKAAFIKIYSMEQGKALIDFTKSHIGYVPTLKNISYFIKDNFKLAYYLFRYRHLAKPGYTQLPDKYLAEIAVPYERWIDDKKFHLIHNGLKYLGGMALSGVDAHVKEEIPAISMFKIVLQFIKFPLRYVNGQARMMREGYQELWNRLAKNHNVRLNCHIQKINRRENDIVIELENEQLIVDKLIIACPPDKISHLINYSAQENTVFTKIHYSPVWRIAFVAKNLPTDAVYVFSEPYFSKEYPNRLITLIPEGKVADNTWVYSGMLAHDAQHSIDAAFDIAKNALTEQFGGEVIELLNTVYWPEYCPYFTSADVQQGIYKKLESLQGHASIFYVGGLNSGISHPVVLNYSYAIIDKFF